MTDLHYLLLGLALLLVGGVVLYNHLQERRLRKQIDSMFRRDLEEPIETREPAEAPVSDVADEKEESADDSLRPLPASSQEPPDTYDEMLTLMRRVPDDQDAESSEPPILPMDRESSEPLGKTPPMMPVVEPKARAVEVPAPMDIPVPRGEPPREDIEAKAALAIEPSPLDPEIECVVRWRASGRETVDCAGLIDRLRRIGKPVRVFGYVAGAWHQATNSAQKHDVVEAGIQLVDRKGAVTLAQLETFRDVFYEFAAEHGGAVSCPDLSAVIGKAKDLDEFCVAVDMLIGLNIVAHEGIPFTGRRVDELARKAGMHLDKLGHYVLDDGHGHSLFTLVNQQGERFAPDDFSLTTPTITLLFDVPNIDDGLAVFDRMTVLGFELARTLGGRMMDDHGHVVTQASLQSDRGQLAGFYERMRARAIPAGGERARRLFA